jgi:hypothetical protein
MGVADDYLKGLIARQVEDHRLVVWYDPERAYGETAARLQLPETRIVRYDGSFFKLRHEIDHLLNDLQAPRLIVYVPADQARTQNALVELEAAGVVLAPAKQPPKRTTRLSLVARNALRPLLGDETASEVERQVEAGNLTLADVNALAEKGQNISRGVVTLVFETGNPQEVALAFLTSDRLDGALEKKSAAPELAALLGTNFDLALPANPSLDKLRERLARHILLTDLVAGLGESVPSALASVLVARSPVGLDACIGLARTWRLRRDLRESYVAASRRVEQEFALGQLAFEPEKIVGIETFLAVERALLRHVEESLLEGARPDLLELAQCRLSRFWSDVRPKVQAHWALIAAAAEVLLEADRVAAALKKAPGTVPALVAAYAEGESPWCLLDTHHRHLETRWHNFDPDDPEAHDGLDNLRRRAVQRYAEVGSQLARHFVTQFQKARHPPEGVLRQVEVFELRVRPKLAEGQTAYVWVDALRFEMGRELCAVLKADFDLTISPALAAIPTITEVGMAALLPGAHRSARVVGVGNGKLGLEIDGTVVKDRKDRVAFLKANAGVTVFDAKLDDLLPKPSKKVREGIRNARLVLVTSQEIDDLGEQDNITQARRQMDGVLNDLRRGFRVRSTRPLRSIPSSRGWSSSAT